MKVVAILALACLCTGLAVASSDQLEDDVLKVPLEAGDLAVDGVTVFADRAEVTRKIKWTAEKAGLVDLTVRGLPQGQLLTNSFRVEVAKAGEGQSNTAAAVTLMGVTHHSSSRAVDKGGDANSEDLETLREDIKKLRIEMEAAALEGGRLRKLYRMVEGWGSTRFSMPVKEAWEDTETLTKALDWRSKQLQELQEQATSASKREDELRTQVLRSEVKLAEAQRSSRNGHKGEVEHVVDVTVSIDVAAAGEVELCLKYFVTSAQWRPLYDIRFDSEAKTMSVVYFAEVQQSTGEDWERTHLHLSTATPGVSGSPPAVASKKVMWAESHQAPRHYASPSNYVSTTNHRDRAHSQSVTQAHLERDGMLLRTGSTASGGFDMQSGSASDSPYEEHDDHEEAGQMGFGAPPMRAVLTSASTAHDGSVTTLSGGADTVEVELEDHSMPTTSVEASAAGTITFAIGKRATVPSTNTPRRVAIQVLTFNASVSYEVVPAHAPSAFMKATSKNDGVVPLLASGDVSIFMDGSFVARSSLAHVSPGQAFSVYLGVDADVKVNVEQPTSKHSKSATAFGLGVKREIHEFNAVTHVTSLKEHPIHVVVSQALPVSVDERIVVEVTQPPRDGVVSRAGSCCKAGEANCGCIAEGSCFTTGASVKENPKRVEHNLLMAPGQKADVEFQYKVSWPSDDPNHHYGIHIATTDESK